MLAPKASSCCAALFQASLAEAVYGFGLPMLCTNTVEAPGVVRARCSSAAMSPIGAPLAKVVGVPSIGVSVLSSTSTWKPSAAPPVSCEVYSLPPTTIVFCPGGSPPLLVSNWT